MNFMCLITMNKKKLPFLLKKNGTNVFLVLNSSYFEKKISEVWEPHNAYYLIFNK